MYPYTPSLYTPPYTPWVHPTVRHERAQRPSACGEEGAPAMEKVLGSGILNYW